MNQSTRNVLAVLGLVAVLAVGVWLFQVSSAAPADRLLVAGDVRPDIRTVSAPAITYPTPDYTVGIPRPAGTAAAPKRNASAQRTGQPTVSGMLKRVTVREGDPVKAGQVVAEFDSTMLGLGVEQAKASARKANKDVSVLGNNIDELSTASRKLATARAKLATARSTLLKARKALLKAKKDLLAKQKQLMQLKAQRPQLQALLAQLKQQAATFPPGHVPPALQRQITTLTGTLAAIDPGLRGIATGLKLIDTNLAKVSKGLAALPRAAARISSAASKLADAKTQLRGAKDVLGIVADSQRIGIGIAETRVVLASVTAPVDGVVTFARHSGTVAMVGAPIVRIRADGAQRVDTYLTAEQVAQVGVGSEAEITYDSGEGRVLHGRVSEIGSAYVFPPTSFPTQIVHMTRAVKVTLVLDDGDLAPAGTPVDVSIHTNTNR